MGNRASEAVNGRSCMSPNWEADMTREPEVTFRTVDRRHSANAGESGARRDIPDGYRPHAVLLGHHTEDQAREFLRDQGIHPDSVSDLMQERARAQSRIRTLAPFVAATATLPVQDAQAIAEIRRIMAQPECRAAFPEGTWTAELVEIAKLIPIHPSLDVRYAESLGGASLDPSQPISALQLCFAAKHASPFHFSVDHAQKSVNIVGIHPAFEVVSLRAGQQGEDGPLIVSFMVAAPPNMVVVLRHAGRLFLSGGRHRVYRLMQAGFSHVPCVIRDAPGLTQIAPYGPRFFQEPVLMAPRPPLFADFADPELASIAPLRAMRKVIRIRPDEYLIAS
jgi:hypothetical protein